MQNHAHNKPMPTQFFKATALDNVAVAFWQDYQKNNPIGGGMAYENQLRACPLDDSLESLRHIDRLLVAVKKDLQQRSYHEKLVLKQTSFRNFLLFVMFYVGRVISHLLKEKISWQPAENMSQYYPDVTFNAGENKFYQITALFPQSFLKNTKTPPLFVLLSLGAKLFGDFERKFIVPITGEYAHESLYAAVISYVNLVNKLNNPRARPLVATQASGRALKTDLDEIIDDLMKWSPEPEVSTKTTPSAGLNIALQGESRPVLPKKEDDKGRFATGGVVPMSASVPNISVGQVANPPNAFAESITDEMGDVPSALPDVPDFSDLSNLPDLSMPNAVPDTDSVAVWQTGRPKTEQSTPNPRPSRYGPSFKPVKKPTDDNVFSEVAYDLLMLKGVNLIYQDDYKKAVAVLDKFNDMLAKQVAVGEDEMVLSDQQVQVLIKSVHLIQKIAEAGNTDAILSLSLCYFKGIGVAQDFELAAKWVQKAADLQDARAQKFLSRLYYQGLGVAQVMKLGDLWLARAAENGHPEAKKLQNQLKQAQSIQSDIKAEAQKDKKYLKVLGLTLLVAMVVFWLLAKVAV